MKSRRQPESDLQRAIVEALRLAGCTVFVTSQRVKRCACGRWSRGDTGTTKGLPDLFVRAKNGLWVPMEIKAERGRLSREQKLLDQCGLIHIVRSVEQALELAGCKTFVDSSGGLGIVL